MFLYPTLKPQLHVVLNQIVLSALDLSRSQGTKAGEQSATEGSQIDCKESIKLTGVDCTTTSEVIPCDADVCTVA